MKKIVSTLLSFCMVITLMLNTATTVFAASSLTLSVGQSNTRSFGYGIYTASSSNNNVASVSYSSGNSNIVIYGASAGSSTITVQYYQYDQYYNPGINNNYQLLTDTIYVTVTGSTYGDIYKSITLDAGQTSRIDGVFSNVSSLYSSNTSVATASQEYSNSIVVTGHNSGTCRITGTAYTYGTNNTSQNIVIDVTVRQTKQTYTDSITVGVNENARYTQSYYSVTSITSSSPSVATAYFNGQNIIVSGIKAGTATITADVRNNSSSTINTLKLSVTVKNDYDNSNGDGVLTVQVGKTERYYVNGLSTARISSSNSSIATGVARAGYITVTGRKAGTAELTIDATDSRGKSFVEYLTVKVTSSLSSSSSSSSSSSGTGITFVTKNQKVYEVGKTYPHPVVLVNKKAVRSSDLIWTSENTDIVKIADSSGKIYFSKPGSAKLTVKTKDGKYTNSITITSKE